MDSSYNSSRISRQLRLFHILCFCKVTEYEEITKRIEYGSLKMIQRDIAELCGAGVVDVRFSKVQNGYVHSDDDNRCPFKPLVRDNTPKNKHLQKLWRLCFLMQLYYDSDIPYWDEKPDDYESVSDQYRRHFSECSKRTMQRDFEILCEIGYKVRYNNYDKCYMVDFPMELGDDYLSKEKRLKL